MSRKLANRYGYPVFLYERRVYLSDWVEYEHRNDFKKIVNEKLPRHYGWVNSILCNGKATVADGSITWILPDKEHRKKGRFEAFKSPQELANMLKRYIRTTQYGTVEIVFKQGDGSFKRFSQAGLFYRMIRNSYEYQDEIFIPERRCKCIQ